jgi:MFS family permease
MHGAVALATSRSSSTRHPMLVLICTSVPSFMLQLDANIVSVSLPVIARSLNAGFAGIEWVITAYMLSFASLLLPAGPLPFYLCIPLAPLGYPNRLPVLHGHASVYVLVTINGSFQRGAFVVGIPIGVTAINHGSHIIVPWRDMAEREIALVIRLGGAQILLVAGRAFSAAFAENTSIERIELAAIT